MHLPQALLAVSQLQLLPQSLVNHAGIEYGLARDRGELRLVLLAGSASPVPAGFEGERTLLGDRSLWVGPCSAPNAAALRARLPWLEPRTLGLRSSAGFGDRLGLATPGHVRAIRKTAGRIAPIFAQQSIREMDRTGRTPQQVMDAATWGVFQENWQGGFGADADHLKTPADIDACLAVGFTFFTIDPGACVDNQAESASLSELRRQIAGLPVEMQVHNTGLLDRSFTIERLNLVFDEAALLRAVAKYGRAVWHVAQMYRHLAQAAGGRSFELEVSVDETDLPTTHLEHAYIASQLKRLGVQWVSLAPRFVGRFEKGVDYIGDPAAFEADIAGHAAIARHFGPYKLSLHSGSDKFSIYPAVARQTMGLVHLKTAGTSYLEALRTIAGREPALFAEIYAFARERYEIDKASYHVSARLDRAPLPGEGTDWPGLLENFDARQILHVTFGSVLTEQGSTGERTFFNRLIDRLQAEPEVYAGHLERHFSRHLEPFLAV